MKTAIRSCLLFALPLFAVLGVLPTFNKAQASYGDTYAAIAYSQSTRNFGYGENYPTLAGAETRALLECNAPDAVIVTWVQDGWVALALGNDPSAAGFAYATDENTADLLAMQYCSAETTGAHLVASTYSGA